MTGKEIAEKAGVSEATVSRILTGNGYVGKTAKEKVDAVLSECGYSQQYLKRKTKYRHPDHKKTIIGLIGHNVTHRSFVYMVNLLSSISDKLWKNGFDTQAAFTTHHENEDTDFLRRYDMNEYAGVILFNAIETPELVNCLRAIEVPVLLINRYLNALDIDSIIVDNYRLGYMATEHLLSNGHKRIVCYDPNIKLSRRDESRRSGYLAAMSSAGLEPIIEHYIDTDYLAGRYCAEKHMAAPPEKRPTAAFCPSYQFSTGFTEELGKNGGYDPKKLSIVAASDQWDEKHGPIKLTTIEADTDAMTTLAANMLMERIVTPGIPPRKILLPPTIIVRDSVCELRGSE